MMKSESHQPLNTQSKAGHLELLLGMKIGEHFCCQRSSGVEMKLHTAFISTDSSTNFASNAPALFSPFRSSVVIAHPSSISQLKFYLIVINRAGKIHIFP